MGGPLPLTQLIDEFLSTYLDLNHLEPTLTAPNRPFAHVLELTHDHIQLCLGQQLRNHIRHDLTFVENQQVALQPETYLKSSATDVERKDTLLINVLRQSRQLHLPRQEAQQVQLITPKVVNTLGFMSC